MRAIEWIFPHGSRFVEVDMTGSASSVLKTDTRLLSENLFLNYGLESLFKDVAIIAGNVNYIILISTITTPYSSILLPHLKRYSLELLPIMNITLLMNIMPYIE